MAEVFLGLGSNIDRERYLKLGLDALHSHFAALALSSVYESPAVGFTGQPFLNLVARIETDLPLLELAGLLRDLEIKYGRPPNAPRFSPRRLDIDILTYDDLVGRFDRLTLPRDEILEQAFVLCPLAEIAPQALHPATGQSYAGLWAAFDQSAQALEKVDFCWGTKVVSRAAQA